MERKKEFHIPYYLQVAETVRSRIHAKYYKQGDLIPSYQQLEKEFNTSNITARKAIETLVREGVVVHKKGIGHQVSQNAHERDGIIWELKGNQHHLRNSTKEVSLAAEVLEIKNIPCPPRIGKILCLELDSEVWRMRKIRRHQNIIMAYFVTFSDPQWCKNIKKAEAERGAFVKLFSKKSGLTLTHLEQKVKAIVANLDLAAVLKVEFGFPLLYIENIYYSSENKPVLITHIYYRGDRNSYKATIEVSRDNVGAIAKERKRNEHTRG